MVVLEDNQSLLAKVRLIVFHSGAVSRIIVAGIATT